MYPTFDYRNLGHTINPERLEDMIKKAMNKRQNHLLNKKNVTIKIDSKLTKVIKGSSAVSSKSFFVLILT